MTGQLISLSFTGFGFITVKNWMWYIDTTCVKTWPHGGLVVHTTRTNRKTRNKLCVYRVNWDFLSYMFPWEVLQGSEGNGDSWVEMCPWDVSSWENDNHNSKASWSSTAKKGFGAICLLVHNGCSCPSKYQYESANEFSSHLPTYIYNQYIGLLL